MVLCVLCTVVTYIRSSSVGNSASHHVAFNSTSQLTNKSKQVHNSVSATTPQNQQVSQQPPIENNNITLPKSPQISSVPQPINNPQPPVPSELFLFLDFFKNFCSKRQESSKFRTNKRGVAIC